jgi:hypothetical protein
MNKFSDMDELEATSQSHSSIQQHKKYPSLEEPVIVYVFLIEILRSKYTVILTVVLLCYET